MIVKIRSEKDVNLNSNQGFPIEQKRPTNGDATPLIQVRNDVQPLNNPMNVQISNISPIDQAEFGGADRDRTDDLVIANDALYQLSYGPKCYLP